MDARSSNKESLLDNYEVVEHSACQFITTRGEDLALRESYEELTMAKQVHTKPDYGGVLWPMQCVYMKRQNI